MVRERRRQRGLPLPVAQKVLPFRPVASLPSSPLDAGEARVARAREALQAAETAGRSRQVLRELEEAYHGEVKMYQAVLAEAMVNASAALTTAVESDLSE